jgi:hypothetical protein
MEGPPAYVSDVEFADDAAGPDGPPVAAGYPAQPAGYPPPPGAYAPPPPPPPDPAASAFGGAVVGGLIGGLLTHRPGGVVAGAIAGGATGAIVGAQAAQRPGYYWSQGGCYYRYPSGQYVPVDPRSCSWITVRGLRPALHLTGEAEPSLSATGPRDARPDDRLTHNPPTQRHWRRIVLTPIRSTRSGVASVPLQNSVRGSVEQRW